MVLIGEMRDLETIEAALTIGETGHLAFATLHTNGSAVQTINRIVDVFPPYQQAQVRAQLSFVLEGVISPVAPAPGQRAGPRRCALEVMVPEPAIRNLIREDKIHQIYSQMQIGQDKFGMQTMNQSLCAAVPAPGHHHVGRSARSVHRSRRAAQTMIANAQAARSRKRARVTTRRRRLSR